MKGFYKVIRGLMKAMVFLFFRFKAEGVENIPADKNFIICCNHVSFFDPVFLIITMKKLPIRFMAKEPLFHKPVLGWGLRRLAAIPVERSGKGNISAVKLSEAVIEKGELLGIFPEGTRSKDGKLQRGHSGAVLIANSCHADILPCSVNVSKGKVRPFKRVVLRIGKIIPVGKISVSGISASDLRNGTKMVMNAIEASIDKTA